MKGYKQMCVQQVEAGLCRRIDHDTNVIMQCTGPFEIKNPILRG